MSKLHIKKGDTVYVNAGEDKGKTGRVLSVLVKEQRAIVEGINMVSKSTKPNAKKPQGGIVKKEAPIHISNLNSFISQLFAPIQIIVFFPIYLICKIITFIPHIQIIFCNP